MVNIIKIKKSTNCKPTKILILGEIQATMTDGKYIVIKTFKNKLDKFLHLSFIFIEALVKLYIYNEHISIKYNKK